MFMPLRLFFSTGYAKYGGWRGTLGKCGPQEPEWDYYQIYHVIISFLGIVGRN